jgi:hypothetical protein
MSDHGKCEHCEATFEYALLHNGFNDSAYAYCDQCGRLAILDGWKIPEGIKCKIHGPISAELEPMLQPCECGGRFRGNSSPRCPACRKLLSADIATEWIEENAPGTAKGWRWQRNWIGMYAISIESNFVKDNWKQTEPPNKAVETTADPPLS